MAKNYRIGTPEKQEYLRDYSFNPKGYAFLEPGVYAADAKQMLAYNIAKSFYQVYPEVFNLERISKLTGLKKEEIKDRIKKMYDNKHIMLALNGCVSIEGFGLYYWVVKCKKDTTKEEREELAKFFQDNDQICTGYMMDEGGDFDFYNGNHMRNLDNLISGVLDKVKAFRCVEYVHLCPIRRLIRESSVNQFDAKEGYRRYTLSSDEAKKIAALNRGMDEKDFEIVAAINSSKTMDQFFDYDVLAKLSGLDAEEMKKDFMGVVDVDHSMIPIVDINYRSLGLKQRFYLVSLFENTYTFRSEQIADELAQDDRFINIFDMSDAHHNYMLSVFEDVTDLNEIKNKLLSYAEVKEVLEASSSKQFRRWTCRMDSENGLYEECIFTDDSLLDRTQEDK